MYVQHKIKDCSQRIWDVIDSKRGYFYIAGYVSFQYCFKYDVIVAMLYLVHHTEAMVRWQSRDAKEWSPLLIRHVSLNWVWEHNCDRFAFDML